jgi:hypothetical protein
MTFSLSPSFRSDDRYLFYYRFDFNSQMINITSYDSFSSADYFFYLLIVDKRKKLIVAAHDIFTALSFAAHTDFFCSPKPGDFDILI